MMYKFDKQVADSISREGAKLIRILLPDEESVDSYIETPIKGSGVVKCNKK